MMSRLAIDGLALRESSATLQAMQDDQSYGPITVQSFGPENGGLPEDAILVVMVRQQLQATEAALGAYAGVDVTFEAGSESLTLQSDETGRVAVRLQSAEPGVSLLVRLPPHIVKEDENSTGLMETDPEGSVFDPETGSHTVLLTPGSTTTLEGHYFTVSAQIDVVSRSNVQVAPESLILQSTAHGFPDAPAPVGSVVYDARLHVPEYVWIFGEPRMFTALEKIVGEMANADQAFGPYVENSYDTPGVKTPRVTVTKWHNGYKLQAVAEISLTIGDPDVVFAGTNTVFIDPDNDFSGAPAGAAVATTLAQAQIDIRNRTSPARLMFRDGKTHYLTGLDQWRGDRPSIYMTSQKTGIRPIVALDPTETDLKIPWNVSKFDPNEEKDMVWDDLDLAGTWNGATETGTDVTLFLGLDDKPDYAFMHNCTLRGFGTMVQLNDTIRGHFSMTHCDVTDWRAFGSLCSSRYFAFRGNRMAHRINALSGGERFSGHNDHGCIRANGSVGVVQQNDLFCRAGWFPNNFSINGNSLYTQQPCLRLGTTVVANAVFNVQQNTMEGGSEMLHIYPANPAPLLVEPMNFLVERNFLIGSWMTSYAMRTLYGGGSIRNNVFVVPNVDRTNSADTTCFVSSGYSSSNNPHVPENLSAPVTVVNNTVINLMQDANAKSGDALIDEVVSIDPTHLFTGFVVQHNVLHQPFLSTPDVQDGPLDMSALFVSRMTAPYEAFDYGPIPGTETPIDTPVLGCPMPGSPAIDAITQEPLVSTDILGAERSIPDTRGACLT